MNNSDDFSKSITFAIALIISTTGVIFGLLFIMIFLGS